MAHSANVISSVHLNNTDYEAHDSQAEHLDNKVTEVRPTATASNDKYPSEAAVRAAISASTGAQWGDITGTLSDQTDLNTALNAKAPLASPAFTGTPTAPTAAEGNNSTQLATTAFVTTAVGTAVTSVMRIKGTKANEAAIKAVTNAKIGDVWINQADGSEWVATKNVGATADPTAWEKLGFTIDLSEYAQKGDGVTSAGTSDSAAPSVTISAHSVTDPKHDHTVSGSATFTPQGSVETTAADTTTVNSITNVGTLPTHAADAFTQGAFHQGSLPTWSASVVNEVLSFSFNAGSLPTHAADSFTQGEFSQGTLPTKGANTTVTTNGIKAAEFEGTSQTISVSGSTSEELTGITIADHTASGTAHTHTLTGIAGTINS